MTNPQYIYAIGEIAVRFPSLDVEREFWQAGGPPHLFEVQEEEKEVKDITYTVEAGDTLSGIARQYEKSIAELLSVNLLPNPNLLMVGQQIIIPAQREEETLYTDKGLIHKILLEKPHLGREVHWIFTVTGVDVYTLLPRTEDELEQLIESTQVGYPDPPPPSRGRGSPPPPLPPRLHIAPQRKNVVIGVRQQPGLHSLEYPSYLPVVTCDRVFSFSIEELVHTLHAAVNTQNDAEAELPPLSGFLAQAYEEVFLYIAQLNDNAGSADEHRVLNYLVMRDTEFYRLIVEQYSNHTSLVNVRVHPSRLGSYRKVYEVVLTFKERQTDREFKLFARVDVTGEWPFLVTPFDRYFGS